jgi:hypothetical protein
VPGARPHRPEPLGADELIGMMDRTGIDRAVIVPPSPVGDSNDTALEAAARFPARFAVMGRFNPEADAARERLESWLDQPGMLGIRMTFFKPIWARWLAPGVIDWFWSGCERLGIPLMVLAPGLLGDIAALAQRHPGLAIIVDHMGRRSELRDAESFADLDQLLALAPGAGAFSQRRRQGNGIAVLLDRALSVREPDAVSAANVRRIWFGTYHVGLRRDAAAVQLRRMPRPFQAGTAASDR